MLKGIGIEGAKFGGIVVVDKGLRKGAKYAKRAGDALVRKGRDFYNRTRGNLSVRTALEQDEPLDDAPAGEELPNADDAPGEPAPPDDEIIDREPISEHERFDFGEVEEDIQAAVDEEFEAYQAVNEAAAAEMGELAVGGLAESIGIAETMAAGGIPFLGEAMAIQMTLQGIAGGLGMLRRYGRDSNAPESKFQSGFVQDAKDEQKYEYDNRLVKGIDWEEKTHEDYNGPFGWIEKQINDPFNEIMDDLNHKDTWSGMGNLLAPGPKVSNVETGVKWVADKVTDSFFGPRYELPVDHSAFTNGIRISGGVGVSHDNRSN
jgi:hypothetical protein